MLLAGNEHSKHSFELESVDPFFEDIPARADSENVTWIQQQTML